MVKVCVFISVTNRKLRGMNNDDYFQNFNECQLNKFLLRIRVSNAVFVAKNALIPGYIPLQAWLPLSKLNEQSVARPTAHRLNKHVFLKKQ